MNKSSIAGLAATLRQLRIDARTAEKDLFTNKLTIRKIKGFLDKSPIIPPGPSEQVAAVEWENEEDPDAVDHIARKRKREAQESEEDPDYRGAPVERGSKSDVVGQTRSNKNVTAPSSMISTAPSRLAAKARGVLSGSGSASPTTTQNRPTLPTIPAQRPPPTSMDAQLPTPALSASFGQASPTLPGAPPPYDPRMYPQQQQQQQQQVSQDQAAIELGPAGLIESETQLSAEPTADKP